MLIRSFWAAQAGVLLLGLVCHAADGADDGTSPRAGSLIDPPEVALRKFTVAPGLKVDLFAAEPDVRNPVAISIDEHGRVFVVESDRRRSSVFDIRGHKDWLDADFSFRTVQERADFLKQQVSPTNPAVIKRLTGGGRGTFEDFNMDGAIDWRDLEVQSERIRLLEDTNGDGRADRVSVFADGFTNILAGVAAGVLARRDEVYFACIPDLWRISKSVNSRSVISPGTAAPLPLNTGSLTTDSLLHGFGVHIAFGGHDMHGLIFGPDGKLYWSIADRGTDTNLFAKIKNPIPGLTPELLADSGCIFRANPDGSDFEVIAWGLRNPQELAFDEFGNLFTADNNGDGGDKARWHYVVEGADFGWRIGWQWLEARAYQPKMGPWNGERLWHLAESNTAAYLLPPLAHIGHGPAGLAYNPGTGLPPQFDRHFFLCDFPGYVLMWTNIPDGASFKIGPVKNFFGDLGPTDVAFHPDGGVLVSDWFKSFDKSDKGRIYRIHDPATDTSPLVQETKRLLAEGMAKRSVKELAELLGHRDMRVRLEAQWELTRRGKRFMSYTIVVNELVEPATNEVFRALSDVALNPGPVVKRLHAIWVLTQLAAKKGEYISQHDVNNIIPRKWMSPANSEPVRIGWAVLKDGNPELRVAALQLIGGAWRWDLSKFMTNAPDHRPSKLVLPHLEDAELTVRLSAAQCLSKIGSSNTVVPLVNLLRDNADRDLYLRHAAVVALARIGDTNALLTAAFRAPNSDSARNDAATKRTGSETGAPRSVRLGVLLALRRLGSLEVARFLSDPDPQIVLEAARAINDVPIPAAMPELAAMVAKVGQASSLSRTARDATNNANTRTPDPSPSASGSGETPDLLFFTLRRALNANFRLGHITNALALASFAARAEAPEPLRIEALELLADWPKPPGRDHFTGLWRPLPPRDAAPATEALRPVLASLLRDASKDIRLAAIKTAAALRVKDADLPALVADRQQSSEVRIEALKLLAQLNDERFTGALNLALTDSSEPLRITATKLQGGGNDVSQFAKTLESGSMAERQSSLSALATAKGEAADALVAKQLDSLLASTLPKELELDVLEAASQRVGRAVPSAPQASPNERRGEDTAPYLQPMKDALAKYEASLSKTNPLASYRPALHGGNAANGKVIFIENQQIACFRCHKINGEGGDVGPDLTGLGDKKGREYLLEAIVQPNKEIAAGFENVFIEMNDGASYAGLVKSETDAELVLNSPEDGVMTLKKTDIKLRQRGLSAMPEELVTYLSKRELRDLIEFLVSAK